jgi:hypothetical protein
LLNPDSTDNPNPYQGPPSFKEPDESVLSPGVRRKYRGLNTPDVDVEPATCRVAEGETVPMPTFDKVVTFEEAEVQYLPPLLLEAQLAVLLP